MKLTGVVVPVAVPLDERRRPDYHAYRGLIRFLLQSGVHGLFVNGSMGAFALLTDEEQRRLLEVAVEEAGGKVPIVAGIADTGPARVMERMFRIDPGPITALVLLPPFYYVAGQSELIRFFHAIADRAPRPLFLYENPRLAKNSLDLETILQLARHGNIRGIKISTNNREAWSELVRCLGQEDFSLICGAGRDCAEALRMGFDGITEGLHNIVPSVAVSLYNASRAGDHACARHLQDKINRCFEIFDIAGGWRGLEVAFSYMNIASFAAPPPYDEPIGESQRRRILDILAAENIPRAG